MVLAIIIPIGVAGFMLLERFSLLDAIWLTVITLATIGYGDIYARTEGGRVFTVLLILFDLVQSHTDCRQQPVLLSARLCATFVSDAVL